MNKFTTIIQITTTVSIAALIVSAAVAGSICLLKLAL